MGNLMVSCENKSFEQMKRDYQVLKQPYERYKSAGAPVPVGLSKAMTVLEEAFILGGNVDEAFKSVCQQMEGFLSVNEESCARMVGFDGSEDLQMVCSAMRFHQYQGRVTDKVMNIGDPTSFMSIFTAATKEQIRGILKAWLKKTIKGVLKPGPKSSNPPENINRIP